MRNTSSFPRVAAHTGLQGKRLLRPHYVLLSDRSLNSPQHQNLSTCRVTLATCIWPLQIGTSYTL